MRKEYVVKMSMRDKNKYEKILNGLHQYLSDEGQKLEGEKRQAVWARIRSLNDVIEVFED